MNIVQSHDKSIGFNALLVALVAFAVVFSADVFNASAQTRHPITYQSSDRHIEVEAYLAESVDVPPEFPGGEVALMRYINSERCYPEDAYHARVQGRVLCAFVVAPDGSVKNVEILRGVDESLNREALRVIERMPRWKAGRIGSAAVPVLCILPIPFRL